MKPINFFMSLLLCAAGNLTVSAQVSSAGRDAFVHSTQMIVVTASDWNAVEGRLQRFERDDPREKWRPAGEPIPIVVGRNGMGWGIGMIATDDGVRGASDPQKKEGDGKAPAGVFALGTAFGYAPQPLSGLKLPYLHLTPATECVDDAGSKYYNRVVERSSVERTGVAPDWNSSEHMRSVGEAYRWGIVVGHNGGAAQGTAGPSVPGAVAGKGSCVFLHIWGGPSQGTAGCTAMPQDALEALLVRLDPARKPLLVQMPAAEYARLSHLWGLP